MIILTYQLIYFSIQQGHLLTLFIFYFFVYISSHKLQHAWEESLDHFITCLERSGEEGPFWVCAFSIFQNQGDDDDKPTIAEQLGPNPEFGPFATVLKQADVMIAAVTRMCNIYTRLWYVRFYSFLILYLIVIFY